MGMFDSVVATCPKCGCEIEFQSKAGTCNLNRFQLDEVPVEIASNINGELRECENCGEMYRIQIEPVIKTVRMRLA